MIQERVKAGLQRAKANGKTLGRPAIDASKRDRILALRSEGWGIRKIAKELGTGVGTTSKLINQIQLNKKLQFTSRGKHSFVE